MHLVHENHEQHFDTTSFLFFLGLETFSQLVYRNLDDSVSLPSFLNGIMNVWLQIKQSRALVGTNRETIWTYK